MNWYYSSLKNRFYISILALIASSLVIIGITTFYFFKDQNSQYHHQRLIRKEKTVTSSLQYFLNDLSPNQVNEFITKEFDYKVREISDVNNLPIIIYNLSGDILINTQDSLLKEKLSINSLNIDVVQSLINSKSGSLTETSNLGVINSYSYAYNNLKEKMLIIKIFYNSSNYSDKTELWLFLEKLLKIFLLLFIGAGIIAYFLSTYITKSIASISQKIKNVEIGENNERLKWKSNDEIGVLVAAYNEMLTKLELSKEKLAQNERQSAWREMAKQVAHEIKNPLTPMKLSVQHLSRSLETVKKKDTQTIKDFQNNMIQQINLLTEISDEFSNYAELPKGNMREIDLLVIIDKIVSLFKHEKKVKFQIKSSDLTTANILGDENQLIRVFNNLIQNSLEAMNEEGSITIDILLNKQLLCVNFKDSGPGVLKEIQPKIFEPQFTTKSKGKGLGLALVWQILLSHKATISLTDSQFGAHFIISFPSYESES